MQNKFKIISYVNYPKYDFKHFGNIDVKKNEYEVIVSYYNFLVPKYCQMHDYAFEFREITEDKLSHIINQLKIYEDLDNTNISLMMSALALYKFQYINEVLNRDEDEYIVFLDIDALPSNPNIKLQSFIDDKHDLFLTPANNLYHVLNINNKLIPEFNNILQNNSIIKETLSGDKKLYLNNKFNELLNQLKTFLFTATNEGFIIIKNTEKMKKLFNFICNNFHLSIIRNKAALFDQGAEGKILSFFIENNYFYKNFTYMNSSSMGHYYGFDEHKYDENKHFILHNYSVMSKEDCIKCLEIMKHNKWWKPILNNTKNDNILIILDETALGDFICTTSFFKDFSEQYPNKNIYVTINWFYVENYYSRFLDVFKTNKYVKIWNGEDIDIIVKYKNVQYLQASKFSNDYNMGAGLYKFFYEQTGINVEKRTNGTVLCLTDEEKSNIILNTFNIPTDKPIGIINFGVNINYNSCKLQDIEKLQNIIDKTSHKICWVQVGQDFCYQNFKLNNCINLINQTNIRELFSLIYHAQYIVCPLTSIIHVSAMNEYKHIKQIFVLAGTRQNINWYNTYNSENTKFYYLNYNPEKYKSCLNTNEKCCLCDVVAYTDINKNLNLKLCKNIHNGKYYQLPKCLADIDETFIINKINN